MRRAVSFAISLGMIATLVACSGDDSPTDTGDATQYCVAVRAGQGSLSGDVQDPTAAAAAVSAFEQLVATAPATVRDDVKTVAALIEKIADADPADQAGVANLFAAALDPSFLAASNRMREFTQQQCGIDLSSATPSLSAPTSTP